MTGGGGGGGGGGGAGDKNDGETESRTPFVKSLLGASVPPPPPPHPNFGPHCQAESRSVIKTLILVGTVIVLVLTWSDACFATRVAHQ